MRPLGEDGEGSAFPNVVAAQARLVNFREFIVKSVRVFLHAPHLRPCTSRVIRRTDAAAAAEGLRTVGTGRCAESPIEGGEPIPLPQK